MKVSFFRIVGFILAVWLLAGCMSGGSGDYEYYDYEEVMDIWEEGVYDMDAEEQLSTYWPEAEAFFHFSGEGEPTVCADREEIRVYFERLYENYDIGDYELPDWELLEDNGSEAVIRYYHESLNVVEVLRITRRGELWGVLHHEIYRFEPIPVNSTFMAHADEDGDGKLDVAEYDYFMNALFVLLFFPHEADNPFDRIFDGNEDGFVDEKEQALFRRYLFRKVLPVFFKRNIHFARETADLNHDDRVDEEEMKRLLAFLFSFYPDGEEKTVEDFPLGDWIDNNKDGIIGTGEQMDFFHMIFSNLITQPHPADPRQSIEDEPGEMAMDFAEESAVGSDITARIRGKRIAVVGIDSMTEKISEDTRKGLILFVENSFVNTGQVKVVDRNSIEKIIAEYNFQAGGLTDEQTAVEIGKLAGAEIIVTGSLSAVGSNFYLQLRLIDVETAEVVASSLGEAKIENEFLNMSNQAVERLF